MKVKLLTKTDLKKLLKKVDAWEVNPKNTVLSQTRIFKNHIDALVFIARVTVHAQVLDHHPDILFTYKKVKLSLTTHDLKGLTKKDFDLAERIDSIKGG